jgi:mannosyltransferase
MVRVAGETSEPSAPVAQAADRSSSGWWSRHRIDGALILAVIVAIALRFWHLGSQSLWYDEYITTLDLKNRLAEMVISALPHTEGSPPLYFVLQWFWVPIVGRGDAAVRSLSALAGIATVPVTYLVARELQQSRRIARIAAFLVAVNPLLVWYSQEARPYSLLALTGTISVFFWARALRRQGRRDALWWGIAAAAALCTHYFAVFLILPELAWLMYMRRDRVKDVVWGCIPLAIVVIPLGVLALAQRGENQAWIGGFPIELRFAEMGRSYLLGPAEPWGLWYLVGVVIVVIAAVAVISRGEPGERSAAATMAILGLSGYVLALLATLAGADYILGRNLIASFVTLLLVVAIGLGAKRAGWLGIAAAAVLCVGSTAVVLEVAGSSSLQKPDWRAVAGILDHGGTQRAVVIDAYLGAPLERYLHDFHTFDKEHKHANVRRIDLIYHVPEPGFRCGRWSGLQCEAFFFPELPKALAKEFPLTKQVHHQGFVINRYEADGPVRVTKQQLLGHHAKHTTYVIFPGRQSPTRR